MNKPEIENLKELIQNKSKIEDLQQHKPEGIIPRLDVIEQKIDAIGMFDKKKKKKEKPYKLKWKTRKDLKRIAKKNKVLVALLKTNRTIDFKVMPYKNEMIYYEDTWRRCALPFIWLLYGKTPTIVLPEWNLEPIGLEEYQKDRDSGNANADAQKIIIDAIEKNKVEQKGKFNAKVLIIVMVIIIVIIALVAIGAKYFNKPAVPTTTAPPVVVK